VKIFYFFRVGGEKRLRAGALLWACILGKASGRTRRDGGLIAYPTGLSPRRDCELEIYASPKNVAAENKKRYNCSILGPEYLEGK
jgi:hypothetical protein